MTQELMKIKEELVVFLRNSDILSTTTRGVTTYTDTGTFAGETTYTLANSPTLVKNVRSVVVDGTTLTAYEDYTVNYSTGVITFTSAQTGAYTISYDVGSTDRIFPDYPQENLKLSAYPRIAVEITDSTITELGVGASETRHDYTLSIVYYSRSREEIENKISDIQDLLLNNKKNFQQFEFITPKHIGPILPSPAGNNKVFARTIDFDIQFNIEIV